MRSRPPATLRASTSAIGSKTIAEPRPGVFVYDFGQNASGIVRLKVRGPRGATVTISPGELVHVENRRPHAGAADLALVGVEGGHRSEPVA